MRRQKEKREKKPVSVKKIVILAVVLGAVALVSVFGVLALTRERINYNEARDDVSAIASTKESVEKFLDTKPTSLEFSDADKAVINEFESAITKSRNYITSFEALNVSKDKEVAEKFNEAKGEFGKLETLYKIWGDVKLLLDPTDENLATLKNSSSQGLRTLAEELGEYRAELANFKKQYTADGYSKLEKIGEDLNKKYENVTLDEIAGMSRYDILGFYAKIEELNSLLATR